ncbi:MAG TPA: hypothetical protein VE173_05080 [Longimicrobiales bacterium]|nr:hypothetical protein [Longimicrobiales bacterium]
MDTAIVFTYGRSFPGREGQALEAFTQALAFFGTHSHEGDCGEALTFMGPSGVNLMIVPGTYEKLYNLVHLDEFLDLYTKALIAVPDPRYEIGNFGEGVQTAMARWARITGDLHLV